MPVVTLGPEPALALDAPKQSSSEQFQSFCCAEGDAMSVRMRALLACALLAVVAAPAAGQVTGEVTAGRLSLASWGSHHAPRRAAKARWQSDGAESGGGSLVRAT